MLSVEFSPLSHSSFISFSPQYHSVKANEVLKEIFLKIEIITTITKRERKESQKHNIEKMHI